MRAHAENALAVAHYLESSPFVDSVSYPGENTLGWSQSLIIIFFLSLPLLLSLFYFPLSFTGLPSHPQHELAKKMFSNNGFGSMVSFKIKGDLETAKKFLTNLKVYKIFCISKVLLHVLIFCVCLKFFQATWACLSNIGIYYGS